MSPVDFLVIGHICKDMAPAGFRLGGTATYAALTARNLGAHAGVLTRAGPDLDVGDLLAGIELRVLPSAATTTFHNTYQDGRRSQRLLAVGDPITVADVPADWRDPPIVLLGPLAQELDAELVRAFPSSLVGVSPQGWMRAWDASGRVYSRPGRWLDLDLRGAQVVVVSDEDIAGELGVLERLIAQAPIVVLTAGWKGATLYMDGRAFSIAPRPAREVDPTGAGDVFAAAFLVRLAEGGDAREAARFASVAASFSVEAPAQEGIPSRAQVEAALTPGPSPKGRGGEIGGDGPHSRHLSP